MKRPAITSRRHGPPALVTALSPVLSRAAEHLDRRFSWDRLPLPLGVATLIGLRGRLRARNLYDVGLPPKRAPAQRDGDVPRRPPQRTIDGRCTDPTHPEIGAANTRFGRNMPIVLEDRLRRTSGRSPEAEHVSSKLLRRGEFKPATSLNLLAAAWLQFEVHDWFAHQVDPAAAELALGLSPLKRDPEIEGALPIFLSDQTHWWDASQLYGAQPRFAEAIRCRDGTGRVQVDDDLLATIARFGDVATEEFDDRKAGGRAGEHERTPNPVPNLWLGLGIFHVVFAREHNAICERLREVYPSWSDERLYNQARLVNAAVMAKIHTVEWTPALIAHPTTVMAIRATWWGLLGERARKRFGRIGAGELLSGIPGSRLDDDVPYALTEEFAAVYRMHPLLPERISFYRASDGTPTALGGRDTVDFMDLAVTRGNRGRIREHLDRSKGGIAYEDAWYSLGIGHPGALTLHNYPTFEPELPGGTPVDLGAADILRTRECGVPRYNEFRRSLRLPEATTFRDAAGGDADLGREIEEVYGEGNVEDVDLIVGLLADRKPEGFAISDTAFRIFLLMAARRLRSDRFFTSDYTPAVYTRAGLAWIEEASMGAILRRHYPALEPALRDVDNPFKPWPRMPAPPSARATRADT